MELEWRVAAADRRALEARAEADAARAEARKLKARTGRALREANALADHINVVVDSVLAKANVMGYIV